MLLGSLALLLTGVSVGASSGQQEAQPPSPSGPSVSTATRASFAGVWAYNAHDSLNAANGRSEDAPGATHRSKAGSGPDPAAAGAMAGTHGITGFGQGNAPVQSPFASLIVNERRDLVRDLLEVPVELTIKLADGSITFVDHLARELTYQTTGKKQKYQLSASIFEAKTYWDGPQLKKDIEATEGFKMRETYFLSEDGKRLFVIVRLGDPKGKDPEAPIVGVNRVYDRIER
jgi:hypothetical protein